MAAVISIDPARRRVRRRLLMVVVTGAAVVSAFASLAPPAAAHFGEQPPPPDQPSFDISFVDNAEGDFASRGWLDPDSAFQRNVRAAFAIWASRIRAEATVTVEVSADNTVARAAATFSHGRPIGVDADGNQIFEPASLSAIAGAPNEGGRPDILVLVNSGFVDSNYWMDPTPDDRTDETVPVGMTDLVSIVLHEAGHGLGIAGTRARISGLAYGTLPGFANPMDTLSSFGGDGAPLDAAGQPNPLAFNGPRAMAVYGGPVPLAHVGPDHSRHAQDFYHVGACGDPAILTASIMNGCSTPTDGTRLTISAIDLAVLADLGYPLVDDTPVTRRPVAVCAGYRVYELEPGAHVAPDFDGTLIVGTPGDDGLSGTDGDDLIIGLSGDDHVLAGPGDDIVCGGPGEDSLAGGHGQDRLFGGDHADRVLGGSGDDTVAGNRGADLLAGDRGDDRLLGGNGGDSCRGGHGRDGLHSCEAGEDGNRTF